MSGKKNLFSALIGGLLLTLLLCFPSAAAEGVQQGLSLFVTAVLPSVFPFFTVTSCLSMTGTEGFLHPVARPLTHLMRLPEHCGGALLLSLLSGCPNGARLLREKGVSPDNALRFLAICSGMSPLFVVFVVGRSLGDTKLGLFLYAVVLASGFLTGLLYRKTGSAETEYAVVPKPLPFLQAFPKALSSSCLSCLTVAGSMAFFGAIKGIFTALPLDQPLHRVTLFFLPGAAVSPLLSGLLEVGTGCKACADAALALSLRLSMLSFLCSFGGLSMAMQVTSFLPGLRASAYLLQRLVQGSVAFCLCRVLCLLLPGFV